MLKKVRELEEKIRQMESDIQYLQNDIMDKLGCSSEDITNMAEALEKSRPMKILVGETGTHGAQIHTKFYCPRCNNYQPGIILKKYCDNCGQKLDWEEKNERNLV